MTESLEEVIDPFREVPCEVRGNHVVTAMGINTH